ncbi:MAG TPA: IS21 family transposase [Dehalococcoidia bacterium]|nr:IS21 family transposase [Dehalococcoidia bacterium]
MGRSKASVELFETIRREYEFGVGTIQGVARTLGVHRRLVREALASAVPAPRKRPQRARPTLGPLVAFIDDILQTDKKAPRKQRHTAHRIYTRIRQERPECPVAEPTIRRYVRQRKLALGLLARETFVPQAYEWGVEAQVDWYEAAADLDGERTTCQVFTMRSMASAGAFHVAYRHATQLAFLEAHELAFAYFGGVFRRLRYDNLGAAVKRVLRGSRREETQRFIAFRSHWRFEAEFCTPGEGHEKGGVEGEVGTFRRNHWVPIPQAQNLADLNAQLLAACRADEARVPAGHAQAVGTALVIEREHLLPLAAEGFDLSEVCFPTIDTLGRVKVRTNAYSVPLKAGTPVQVKLFAARLEVWHDGRCVTTHERCYGRHQEVLHLEHYLDVLAHKPGALAGSKPLAQWRQAGAWPASYDTFWEALIARQGKQAGTKAMIELLQLGRSHGQAALRRAIETALDLGVGDAAAVRHLLAQPQLARAPRADLAVGALTRFERPLPALDAYDALLAVAG